MKQTLVLINSLKEKGLLDDYAIGGGIAALFYIEPFLTYDLDLFIIPAQQNQKGLLLLSDIFNYLESVGCFWRGEHIVIEGIPVQFIPADDFENEAVKHANEAEYEGVKTKIIAPEYLIAILLRAGRKKDLEKVERLLEQTEINREKLAELLDKLNLTKKLERMSYHEERDF